MNYIIAYGNELRGDDGVASHIIGYIKEKQLNKQIDLLDFANNAWGILSLLNSDSEKILIIDCAYMGKKPGSFQFFSLAEVSNQHNGIFQAHGNNLIQLINIASQLGYPKINIYFMGIEPYSLEIGQHLSSVVESKINKYACAATNFFDNIRL